MVTVWSIPVQSISSPLWKQNTRSSCANGWVSFIWNFTEEPTHHRQRYVHACVVYHTEDIALATHSLWALSATLDYCACCKGWGKSIRKEHKCGNLHCKGRQHVEDFKEVAVRTCVMQVHRLVIKSYSASGCYKETCTSTIKPKGGKGDTNGSVTRL